MQTAGSGRLARTHRHGADAPPPLLPSLLDNPWVDSSSEEDIAALEHEAGEVGGCKFRNFANASFYSRTGFVDEYVAFKRCTGAGPFDAWAADKIAAGAGSREELVIETGFEFESATQCKPDRPPLFLFAVASAAGDLRRRKAIRRTWAKGVARGGNSLVLFFIADGVEHGAAVGEEAARYGDVIRCKGLVAAEEEVSAAEMEARMVTAVLAWTYREEIDRLAEMGGKSNSDEMISNHQCDM